MLEVEVLGLRPRRAGLPKAAEVRRLSLLAASAAGVRDGHLAIEFVDPERIAQLNARVRGKPAATDVLSFPIDGRQPLHGDVARELGDVVICPQHARDVREAIVHGVLHLVGFDHETDDGEMLRLQRQLLASEDA
jgi:probable rRNA maturation factor